MAEPICTTVARGLANDTTPRKTVDSLTLPVHRVRKGANQYGARVAWSASQDVKNRMELCCVGCADYVQCGCCLVLFQLSKQHISTFQLVRSGESEAFDGFGYVAERVWVRVSRIFGRV